MREMRPDASAVLMEWLSFRSFSRAEKAWMLLFGAALALLTTLPYLIFYSLTPDDQRYAWASVFYYDDYFQYYAWGRHLSRGEWLIRNYYTDNPAASYALFNPAFLALGWLTKALGNVFLASHLLRVVAVAAFAWISYAFIAIWIERPALRRAAQLLLLGGGLEYPWFMIAARMGATDPRIPTPLADPYVFKILYRYSHLTIALCLLLIAFGCWFWIAARGRKSAPGFLGLGVSLAALGFISPYYLVLSAAVIAAHSLALVAQKDFSFVAPAAVAALAAVGPALQYKLQPITSNLGSIAMDDPIYLSDFLLFFAPLLLWAGMRGTGVLAREESPSAALKNTGEDARATHLFLAMWIVVVLLLVLSPLRFRARMVFGLQLPLAILAAQWVGAVVASPRGVARTFLLWLFAGASCLMTVEWVFTFYKEAIDFREKRVGRIDLAAIEAFAWLDKNAAPGAVVLTSAELGDYLPAFCAQNAYLGHSFQSEDFYERRDLVTRFFLQMTDAERAEFLKSSRINFILVPPIARAKNPAFNAPGWPQAYRAFGYEVYRRPK